MKEMLLINFAIVLCLTPGLALDIGPVTATKWHFFLKDTLYDLKGILLSYDDDAWTQISGLNLTEEFIDEFSEKVNWETISYHQNLTEHIMNKYKEKVDWFWIYELKKPIPNDLKKYLDQYFQKNHFDYLQGRYTKQKV